jgi:hypothetical protein
MSAVMSARRGRILHAIRFIVLAATALVVGHAAVYATHHGIADDLQRSMRAGGHDAYWTLFFGSVMTGAAAVALREAWRIATLHRRIRAGVPANVRHHGLPAAPDGSLPRYRDEARGLAVRLLPVVLTGYTVLENVEHFASHHQHLLGLAPLLGADHPLALPVLVAVTLVAAAVGALVRWRIGVLHARLAAIVRQTHGVPTAVAVPRRWSLAAAVCAHRWMSLRRDAGRAPPTRRDVLALA